MENAAKTMALVVAVALHVGCGGGASPTVATDVAPAATPPASRAHITVTLGLDAVTGPSLDPAYAEYLSFTTTMTESAGVGANLNYVRGEFYLSNALVERYDIGVADLVAQLGSNRIEPGSSRTVPVMLRWNGPCDLVRVTFQFTDDGGNDHYIVGNVGASASVTPSTAGGPAAPGL